MTDCLRCLRPQPDTGYVCHDCATKLSVRLVDLGAIADEIIVTVCRLDRHGSGGYSSAETSLPFDWDAADADWAAHNTITTWARHVSEARGRPIQASVGRPTAQAAQWLSGQLGWLRMRPEANTAWDELHDACNLLRRVVDNPAVRWYAGPCRVPDNHGHECDGELYARPDAAWVTCPTCGIQHNADERRDWLLRQARDQLLHAGWLASALSALGETLPVGTVYSWAARGRILPHGRDANGRPLYRVGDALDLLRRAAVNVA